MFAGVRAIAAAVALVVLSSATLAQIVPPSEQPGRARERFETPAVPLARPGGPIITSPSVEAPPGAAETFLVLRNIVIVGATVYTPEQFRELYADLIGERVSLKDVYDVAGRITAKYGADGYVLSRAIVPPQQPRATSVSAARPRSPGASSASTPAISIRYSRPARSPATRPATTLAVSSA